MSKKGGLGKGLKFVLEDNKLLSEMNEDEINKVEFLNIDEISVNPFQPRIKFDENSLNELSESIKTQGVFQPILVRRSIIGFELISGERRLRASKLANLKQIPSIIYDFDDEQMMEVALVENIQRQDLSVVEEAKSISIMMERLGYTQEQMASKIGKSRAYVANVVRVLKLSDDILILLNDNIITLGHVKVLVNIEDKLLVSEIVRKIIDENLSVRETEKIVKLIKSDTKVKIKKPIIKNTSQNKRLEKILREKLNTKVVISGEENGTIEITYNSENDLIRLLEVFEIG